MMRVQLAFALTAVLVVGAPAAFAATTIVNLSADPNTPNAGKSSGSYAYNPVTMTLAAGTYTVSVAGLAGGGLYDAYAIYAASVGNAAWTDSSWSISLNNGTSAAYTQGNVGGTVADYDGKFKSGRYNTAAAAVTAYGAAAPYVFTLASAQAVSFYLDDTASPYFADDTGGVSLAVSSVVEPATLGLLGVGAIGAAFSKRRRRLAVATA